MQKRGKYEKRSSSQTFDWELVSPNEGHRKCMSSSRENWLIECGNEIVLLSPQVEHHVQDALSRGAKLLRGGARHELGGTFYQPTILTDVTKDMLVCQQETFGPVAPLIRFVSSCVKGMWYFSHQGSCARSASIYRTVLWLLMNSTRFSSAKLCYLIRYGRAVVTHALICGPPPSFVFLQIPNRRGSRNTSQRYKFGPCRLVPIPVFVFERCPINIGQIQGDNVHDIWMSGGFWGIRL